MLQPEQIQVACARLLEMLLPVPTPQGLKSAGGSLVELLGCRDALVGEVVSSGTFCYPGGASDALWTVSGADWPDYWVKGCFERRPQWCRICHTLPDRADPVEGGLWIPFCCSTHVVGAALILGLPEEPAGRELDLVSTLGETVGSVLARTQQLYVESIALRQQAEQLALQSAALEQRSSSVQAELEALKTNFDNERRKTSRKESHLLRRSADFQAIMDSSETVIYVKDCEGRYEFVNRKFEESFNLQREDILRRTDEEVFAHAPELAARFMENDRMVLRLGSSMQFDEVAPHTDGPHNYVSVKFPLRDEHGEVRGVTGISTDITLRIQVERAMQTLENRSSAILHAVADAVVLLDQRGLVEYLNPAAENLLKYQLKDLQQSSFFDLVMPSEAEDGSHDASDSQEMPLLEKCVDVLNVEAHFQCQDGQLIPVEYSSVPLWSEGALAGAVITFRDITSRLERRLEQRELKGAQSVQKMLFPRTHPQLPGFDIAGEVFPKQLVCGDYYDFIYRDEQRLALIVADASGHDLSAAFLMVNARAHLRNSLKSGARIDEVLKSVNESLSQDHLTGKFVTTFLAELDARQRTVTYAGAGHGAVLLPLGEEPVPLKGGALMLGLENVLSIDGPVEIKLHTGDLLLICTDGLNEVQSPAGEPLRWPAVYSLADQLRNRPAQQILNGLIAQSRQHAGDTWPQDDVTIVVVKVL